MQLQSVRVGKVAIMGNTGDLVRDEKIKNKLAAELKDNDINRTVWTSSIDIFKFPDGILCSIGDVIRVYNPQSQPIRR